MSQEIPGDFLVIDESSDADDAKPGQKRSRSKRNEHAKSTSASGPSSASKKARVSSARERTSVPQGSEEGEVDGTQDQSQAQGGHQAGPPKAKQAQKPTQSLSAEAAPADAPPSAIMPHDPPMWSKGPNSFKLPVFATQREGSWLARFNEWLHLFWHNNNDKGVACSVSLVQTAYAYFLDHVSGLTSSKRKAGKKAALAAERSGDLGRLIKKLRATAPGLKAFKAVSNGAGVSSLKASGADASTKQAPGESALPAAGMKREQSNLGGEEGPPNAPSDKLGLAGDDGAECWLCGSTDPAHVPDDCRDHWAGAYPPEHLFKKVVDIPISCAICASREHYFSECPDRVYPPNPSWTLANRARFIDPNCGVLCIADEAKQRDSLARAAVEAAAVVRGPGARTSNVRFSESDDTDIEFMGSRIIAQPRRAGRSHGSGAKQAASQPALPTRLPPEPAPAGMRGQGHSKPKPPAPGGSLPAKPPAVRQEYHDVAPPPNQLASRGRGGRGKRGGRGGRGRGGARGRGK